MLSIVSNYSQTIATGCYTDEYVKIANNNALTNKTMPDFSIVTNPVAERKHGEGVFYLLWFSQMTLCGIAVKGTVSELSNGYFRCKDLLNRGFCNMSVNSTAMTEIFYPSVSIENIPFHIC